ncbi:MAG: GNAT family N-acetyltransferase [Candidatus Thorarchaeota archaeon]|nr:GNAT family N-acetyltransferase [Candidatus Thorarchaeota archaeon]
MCTTNSLCLTSGNEHMFDDYAELSNAVSSFDNPSHLDLSGDFFESLYSSPTFNLKHDTVLVRNSDSHLIGSGLVHRQSTSDNARITIQIHPEFRRQGIGSNILEYFLQDSLNQSGIEIHCRIFNFRPYSIAFANHHGFTHNHTWVKMQFNNTARTYPTCIPRGFRIRALNIKHELELWAYLQNRIFAFSPHYESVSVESLKTLIQNNKFDPNLVVVGELGNTPIGMCMGWSALSSNDSKMEKILQIQGLGVLPEYRREGYATVLLLVLINRGYLKGNTKSELLVLSTNNNAMTMYNKIGFTEEYRHLWYSRKI